MPSPWRRFSACVVIGLGAGAATAVRRFPTRVLCDEHGTRPFAGDEAVCHKKTWGVPWVEDWDNPTAHGYPTQSREIKRQILLVRHGQYENEKSTRDDASHTLTELGQLQARETGRFLNDAIRTSPLYRAKSVRAVYVSDLTRARQTCEAMVSEMTDVVSTPASVDPLLREIFPCDPQPPYPKKARPESERIAEFAFSKYFHRPTVQEPSVELVVAHANVIRYFLCRSLQIPPEAWLRFSLPHCSITMISIDGRGRVSVGGVGNVNHLPPAHQSVMNVR